MGIRETLNKNPQFTTGITAGIIGLALLIILWQIFGGGGGSDPGMSSKRYYTTDTSSESASLGAKFADEVTKVPPFQKDGKDAVGIYAYSCDGGKTEKVAYYFRYSAAAKKRLDDIAAKVAEAQKTGKPLPPEAMMGGMDMAEEEILLPGQTKWLTGQAAQRARSEIKFPCEGEQLMIINP